MPVPLVPFGDAAWRATLPVVGHPRALLDALAAVPRVIDAVVSERHALVTFEPDAPPDASEISAVLDGAASAEACAADLREHVVRVRYDGEDLLEVARLTGLAASAVIERHAAARYRVVAVGFQPGFAYLRAPEPPFALPRRASPRPRVPALSVGVAGPYTGIYPFASPGGWNLLGTAVDFAPFSPEHGAALALGDVVRFEPVEGR